MNGQEWADALGGLNLPGVTFEAASFTPVAIPGASTNPKYKNEACEGVTLTVTDRDRFLPVRTGVALLVSAKKLYGDSVVWRQGSIDRLSGTPLLRLSVDEGKTVEEITALWKDELADFMKIREKYLLYN